MPLKPEKILLWLTKRLWSLRRIVNESVAEHRVAILPVDSEHSAIFQCLAGESRSKAEKLILTASGGPFQGKRPGFFEKVTPARCFETP